MTATKKQAPAAKAGAKVKTATAPEAGYVLQLVSVDADQGAGGEFLDIEDAYTRDIARARRFAAQGEADAWIADHTDHAINEVWQVIDLAANVDEPADAELGAEVAQDDAPAPEWCVKHKHSHEFIGVPKAGGDEVHFTYSVDEAQLCDSEEAARRYLESALPPKARKYWAPVLLTAETLAALRADDPDAPVEDARAYEPATETVVQGERIPFGTGYVEFGPDATGLAAAVRDTLRAEAESARQPNTFQPGELRLLGAFADLAIKAAKAAEGACKKAQLTVGESEALELGGYAEEAKAHIERSVRGEVELARGHVSALRTGAALYLAALEKSRETDESLLLDVSDHDVRHAEAQSLAIRLRGGDLFTPGVTERAA